MSFINVSKQSFTKKITIMVLCAVIISSVLGTFWINFKLKSDANNPEVLGVTTSDFQVGMGLTGVSDYSNQHPFLNIFKTSRGWITQCNWSPNPDPRCKWNTEEQSKLNLDVDGYPKTLPAANDTSVAYRYVETPILTSSASDLPCSRYVVKYDGEGTLEYAFVVKDNIASAPGRDIFDIPSNYTEIAWVKIMQTDPNNNGNYIKNIRAVCEDKEALLDSGKIFNPEWTSKIQPFGQFRFMDWMSTNNSEQKEWANRPKATDYSWAKTGVPVEIMVALANETNTNPWFNMPYNSTPEYQRNFAQYIKDNLKPTLKPSVEFSNEVWNWQFQQAQNANIEGRKLLAVDSNNNGQIDQNESDASPGDSYVQYHGYKTWEMCKNWKEIYGLESARMECGIGSQTAWRGMQVSVTECPDIVAKGLTGGKPCSDNADFFYTAGYFSGYMQNDKSIPVVKSWLANPDPEFAFKQALQQLRDSSIIPENGDGVKQTIESMKFYNDFATTKGLKTKIYEGGNHLTANGHGSQDDQQIIDFFIAVNRRPEMYDLYTQLLQGAKDSGIDTFNHFVDLGKPSKYGSWGSLETLDQPLSTAYRYCALIDFQTGTKGCTIPTTPPTTEPTPTTPPTTTPTCTSTQELINNTCVSKCSTTQTRNQQGVCVDNAPVTPTCTTNQKLINNVCVDNAPTPTDPTPISPPSTPTATKTNQEAVVLLEKKNITFTPKIATSEVNKSDLTIALQNQTGIMEGATCNFKISRFPSGGDMSPQLSSNFFANNNGTATYQNGKCQVVMPKDRQIGTLWQLELRVTNPNSTKAMGLDFDYFFLAGSYGITEVIGN